MAKPEWDKFEWDDENKKGGNVQHLRDHDIEPEEAEECFFHDYILPGTADVLTTFMFLMERLIEEDNCDWFSRTKSVDSREYSQAGN
jgi:hypothetical protein